MCFQITEPVLHSVVDYYSAVCAGLIRRGRFNIHNLESGRLPTEGKIHLRSGVPSSLILSLPVRAPLKKNAWS